MHSEFPGRLHVPADTTVQAHTISSRLLHRLRQGGGGLLPLCPLPVLVRHPEGSFRFRSGQCPWLLMTRVLLPTAVLSEEARASAPSPPALPPVADTSATLASFVFI